MKIVGGLAVRQHQTTLDAGRDVVVLSAAANDRRWRRVTDGNPCAFCAMLATRTDYTSPFAAQYVVGRGKTTRLGARGRRGLGVRPRGSRSLGEKYHDHCGCTVAEVFDDWEPSYAERQQKALYEEARKACKEQGLEPTTKNVLAQMRELGDGTVHDAHVPEGEKKKPGRKPKTQTGGSGGGGKKPPRQLVGFGDDDPNWSARERRAVEYLRSQRGYAVGPGGKSEHNDRLFDCTIGGRKADIKSLDPGGSSNTMRNRTRESTSRGGQARDLVFDLRRSGVGESEARDGVARIWGLYGLSGARGHKVDRIYVIGDGYYFEEDAR